MRRNATVAFLVVITLAALTFGRVVSAVADDELEKRASWTPLTAEQVKQQIDQWLETQKVDELTQAKIDALWPTEGGPSGGEALLEQLGLTIAAVHEPAATLVETCRNEPKDVLLTKFAVLEDEKLAPVALNNLKLLYGRWLAQNDLYDEALAILDGLEPKDVVDPASLLFYQGAGYHRLLDKQKCLPRLATLMENEGTIPRRYSTLAQLMEADLKPLKTDSLDEVSRLMDDIRRRLDLGRAGQKVRKQEDDVIAKLEKLIEELEKQKGGGGGKGGGQIQSSKPAPDSADLKGKGPGNIDPKQLGRTADWGNLPPKERQATLQQISKELPAHYREVIEEYFRKLARDGSN